MKCNKCRYDWSNSGDSAHVCGPVKVKQQEQGEPDDLTIAYMSGLHRGKDLAQQRTWVGLTIKELQDIFNEPDLPEFVTESVRIIEAKLKEKNT